MTAAHGGRVRATARPARRQDKVGGQAEGQDHTRRPARAEYICPFSSHLLPDPGRSLRVQEAALALQRPSPELVAASPPVSDS